MISDLLLIRLTCTDRTRSRPSVCGSRICRNSATLPCTRSSRSSSTRSGSTPVPATACTRDRFWNSQRRSCVNVSETFEIRGNYQKLICHLERKNKLKLSSYLQLLLHKFSESFEIYIYKIVDRIIFEICLQMRRHVSFFLKVYHIIWSIFLFKL